MENEFINSMSLIHESEIKLQSGKKTFLIPLKSVKRTLLLKKRSYKTLINFSIILIIVGLFIITFIDNRILLYIYAPLILFIIVFLFLMKEYDYTFLIIKEYDFVKLKIKKKDIIQVKKIEQLLEQKLVKI